MIKINHIDNPQRKMEICNTTLRSLPNWFGIESAIVDYTKQCQAMSFWAFVDNRQAIGFIAVKQHNYYTAEIYVMAVLEKYHRLGIGQQLVKQVELYCKANKTEYLTVKTLAETNKDPYYARTRSFYLKMQFRPLEVFTTLWNEANPCLLLAKYLA
ncbi:GNAT family N-acetyltransferase [Entomomonas asaccharolytica]|uniref:GNAT family N-acetyltransferase n=1 Tax=Entomomonas asaccharolytica TaxID=2785331 RepID=A0A974NHW1_9GAMM|nr:GNAT family N-acetyltransferase [Entomomonas asaccharolytica]QQP87041.1 GNAT family N-acetyltransferase [Entomomonas asaccharolytica]